MKVGPACRLVLFDFGGTLDAEGVTWRERVAALVREAGYPAGPERFDPVFYAADDALVGTVPATLAFRETVVRLMAGVTRGLGIDEDGLVDRLATRFADDARASVQRNAALLAALGRRYRLGLVSNFYGNLATVCDECGIRELLTVVIDSAAVGCQKPDPRIFRLAVAGAGATADEAVFVGDSPSRDMAGARAAGLSHVWLAGDARRGRSPCCPGDPVISSLSELEPLLR